MKISDTIPLTEEMIHPYLPESRSDDQRAVVRIYKKEKWFIGFLSSITIDSGLECKLRVQPMAEYCPGEEIRAEINLDHHLILTSDPVIQFSDHWQPFKLIDTHKVLSEKECDQTLIIQFSDGLAILSTRDEDIHDVNEFISLARERPK
ncbi:MAG: hypothetical protein V4524_02590 [Patescibacteria group bacterium]